MHAHACAQHIHTHNTCTCVRARTQSYLSKSLIWSKIIWGYVLLLTRWAGELILTEVVLNAFIAIALPTARNDDCILHQFLTDAAEKLRGRFKFFQPFLGRIQLLHLKIINSFPGKEHRQFNIHVQGTSLFQPSEMRTSNT